jgi:hypothetical protein
MASSLSFVQRMNSNISHFDRQIDCCVGVDGRLWDVSNLRSSAECPMSRKSNSGVIDENPRLYPSRSRVRDIPDHDVEALFDALGYAERVSRREDRIGKKSLEYSRPAERRRSDFRSEFSKIARKPSVRQIDQARQEVDDARNSRNIHPSEIDRSSHQPPQHAETSRIEIEVTPGVYLPMHGAAETERALQQGRVRPTVCVCCQSQLYCIMIAEYVVCPHCRSIGPVGFQHDESLAFGGIGLGLTAETVLQEIGSH